MSPTRWIAASLVAVAACGSGPTPSLAPAPITYTASAPTPDPRVGLKAGLHDAGEAWWNMRMVATRPSPGKFAGETNSDLAFTGKYAIQGSYNGFMVWDVSAPATPVLVTEYYCPASQSDVSVYKNLLFVSGEGLGGRVDCGDQGVRERVSKDRLRGIRIFDITDITKPKYLANVQTCRGSHTHTVLEHPGDARNVYIYVSGSAGVRPAEELPGCVSEAPEKNAGSALFRIEVIKVPLAHPEQAAIVSSPRIFEDLKAPVRRRSVAPDDAEASKRAMEMAKARGAFTATVGDETIILPPQFIRPMLDSVAKARGGTTPTGADSAALRAALPAMIAAMVGEGGGPGAGRGPTQCHDITVYPAVGLAGGACEGYGMLLDIRNPTTPVRTAAVADSNFSYWHSATFSNDGRQVLFTDEWGGGGAPKCRATDPKEWGANAIFTIENGQMVFKSYFKLPAAQSKEENCVAHNGSLIPVPGRDIMVQAWYQGGISVFDWTDPSNPVEIAYFDRGPVDPNRMVMGGSWSVYWYNGMIISSEIARGLDIMELTPSALLTQNEIDAAKSVVFAYKNPQGQPKITWPPTFARARALVDQLERSRGLSSARVASVRAALSGAESASGTTRRSALSALASELGKDMKGSSDAGRVRMLTGAVQDLANAS